MASKSLDPQVQPGSQPQGQSAWRVDDATRHPVDAGSEVRSGGVTLRVVLLSLALAVCFGYIIPIIDMKTLNTFLGAAHLPPGAIAVLLVVLLVINPLMRLLSKRGAFTRNELLTVYISCLFSCLVPGHGGENFFVTNIIGPFYFSSRENKWLKFLEPYVKPWLSPALMHNGRYGDAAKAVIEPWYTQLLPTQAIPWGVWLVPLLAWSTMIVASYIMLGCLSVMLRAQWSEREALAFPLLRLPLEMTQGVSESREARSSPIPALFRNPLMWIGFGIAVFIQLLNGLHLYFPDVPQVPLSINTAVLFTEPPWNQIQGAPISIYPVIVGITYLLTAEVSFSLWFFFWFIKMQYVVAYMCGVMPNTLPAQLGSTASAKCFTGYQQIGCYLAYVGLVLWTGREHLRHVARRAFGRAQATAAERHEALSYPVAFWGFVLSFAFIIAWSVAAGINLQLSLVLWLLYLVICIALTRLVVEGGVLFVQQGWTPLGSLGQIFGSGGSNWLLPTSGLVPAAMVQNSMMTDMRAFLMPSFVQSFKLAHDRKINARQLLALISAVTLITLAMSEWMNVRLGYRYGGLQLDSWAANGGAQLPAKTASDLIKGAHEASLTNIFWVGLGVLLTCGMMVARSRFLWFPLHPLGFLLCLTFPINIIWFSTFLGWLFKVLISRFGGSDGYRKLIPTFLGLALGDVSMMILWLIVDGYFGRTGHKLMPG